MREEGVVICIGEETSVIETLPAKECKGCASCGASRPRRIKVDSRSLEGVKAGDHVTIDVPAFSMMKLYMLLYGLPLVVFAGVVLFLYYFSKNPLISFLVAAAATGLVYLITGKYLRNRTEFMPTVCARLETHYQKN